MKPIFNKIKTKFTKCLSVAMDDEGQFSRYALSPGKKVKSKVQQVRRLDQKSILGVLENKKIAEDYKLDTPDTPSQLKQFIDFSWEKTPKSPSSKSPSKFYRGKSTRFSLFIQPVSSNSKININKNKLQFLSVDIEN